MADEEREDKLWQYISDRNWHFCQREAQERARAVQKEVGKQPQADYLAFACRKQPPTQTVRALLKLNPLENNPHALWNACQKPLASLSVLKVLLQASPATALYRQDDQGLVELLFESRETIESLENYQDMHWKRINAILTALASLFGTQVAAAAYLCSHCAPISVLEYSMDLWPSQVRMPLSDGRLPLHIAASHCPTPPQAVYAVGKTATIHQSAAPPVPILSLLVLAHDNVNNDPCTDTSVLETAWNAGYTWSQGLSEVWMAQPTVVPHQMTSDWETCYVWLRASPGILLQYRETIYEPTGRRPKVNVLERVQSLLKQVQQKASSSQSQSSPPQAQPVPEKTFYERILPNPKPPARTPTPTFYDRITRQSPARTSTPTFFDCITQQQHEPKTVNSPSKLEEGESSKTVDHDMSISEPIPSPRKSLHDSSKVNLGESTLFAESMTLEVDQAAVQSDGDYEPHPVIRQSSMTIDQAIKFFDSNVAKKIVASPTKPSLEEVSEANPSPKQTEAKELASKPVESKSADEDIKTGEAEKTVLRVPRQTLSRRPSVKRIKKRKSIKKEKILMARPHAEVEYTKEMVAKHAVLAKPIEKAMYARSSHDEMATASDSQSNALDQAKEVPDEDELEISRDEGQRKSVEQEQLPAEHSQPSEMSSKVPAENARLPSPEQSVDTEGAMDVVVNPMIPDMSDESTKEDHDHVQQASSNMESKVMAPSDNENQFFKTESKQDNAVELTLPTTETGSEEDAAFADGSMNLASTKPVTGLHDQQKSSSDSSSELKSSKVESLEEVNIPNDTDCASHRELAVLQCDDKPDLIPSMETTETIEQQSERQTIDAVSENSSNSPRGIKAVPNGSSFDDEARSQIMRRASRKLSTEHILMRRGALDVDYAMERTKRQLESHQRQGARRAQRHVKRFQSMSDIHDMAQFRTREQIVGLSKRKLESSIYEEVVREIRSSPTSSEESQRELEAEAKKVEAQLLIKMHQMLSTDRQLALLKKQHRDIKKFLLKCQAWLQDQDHLEDCYHRASSYNDTLQLIYEETVSRQDAAIAQFLSQPEEFISVVPTHPKKRAWGFGGKRF